MFHFPQIAGKRIVKLDKSIKLRYSYFIIIKEA